MRFIPDNSWTAAMLMNTDDIVRSCDEGKCTAIVLFDISEALYIVPILFRFLY